MKRYNYVPGLDGGMSPRDQGKYVKYKHVADLQRQLAQARATIELLEQARPHWAQGWTDDGVAAQAATGALSAIWKALGVQNQTAAMIKLQEMTK